MLIGLNIGRERGYSQFRCGYPTQMLVPEMVDKLPGFQAIEPVVQVFSHDPGGWGLQPFTLIVRYQANLLNIVIGA